MMIHIFLLFFDSEILCTGAKSTLPPSRVKKREEKTVERGKLGAQFMLWQVSPLSGAYCKFCDVVDARWGRCPHRGGVIGNF